MADEQDKVLEGAVGADGNDGGNDWTVPEGLEADDFDENHALKPESVKSKRDALAAERDNFKKQAEDFRKKISVKDGLGTPEEYSKGFKAPEQYESAMSGENGGFITGTLSNFDKIAHANKLNLEQANGIKGELFKLLEDVGIISDTEARKAALEAKQKEILGDDAAEVVKRNVDFVKGYDVFSENEKAMLTLAAEQGNPLIVSVLDKFRVLFGQGKSSDIPKTSNSDGLAPDEALWEEYNNPKTSDERKMDIMKKRVDAGRPLKFAHI